MTKTSTNKSATKAIKATSIRKPSYGGNNNKPSTGGIRILLAVAQKHRLGEENPCRRDVASIAGYSKKWDSFRVTCKNYEKKGLLEFPDSKTIKLTKSGWDTVGPEMGNMHGLEG